VTRTAWRLRTASTALLLAAAGAGAEPVSFKDDVVPLLTTRCVVCHVEGADQAHLSLYPDAWVQLVGVASTESPLKRVEPGAPAKSYLYLKLLGTQAEAGGSGARMPFQQDPLAPADIEVVRKWIEQGAKQN
jgi:hypothetical protein